MNCIEWIWSVSYTHLTVSEDGSISAYEYYADTSDPDIQDQVYHETSVDAEGNLTQENYYEYDEWGNEIEDYDAFEDRTTVSDYYAEDENCLLYTSRCV